MRPLGRRPDNEASGASPWPPDRLDFRVHSEPQARARPPRAARSRTVAGHWSRWPERPGAERDNPAARSRRRGCADPRSLSLSWFLRPARWRCGLPALTAEAPNEVLASCTACAWVTTGPSANAATPLPLSAIWLPTRCCWRTCGQAAAKPPRRELAHRALEDITLHRQLRVLLVQGLRDGGELELTTPITNEFNPPPPAVRSVRSGTGLLRKCRWPDPAARIPATCCRVPGGPPGQ